MLKISYLVSLFIAYHIMFGITGFSMNTAAYGLFALLLFFYHITNNLDFSKKAKYHSILINIIIFMIFLFFYKNISIFIAFLGFSLIQMLLYKIFKRVYERKNNLPAYNWINKRNFVKVFLDSVGIVLGIVLAFILKYDFSAIYELKFEYIATYLAMFLIGYTYLKMSDKSWSYTNILDVLNLLVLNLGTAILFLIVMMINRDRSFPVTTIVMIYILSISIQLLSRYVFRLKRYYGKHKKNLSNMRRTIIYGAGEAGAMLAREYLVNPNFPYDLIGFIDDDSKKIGTSIYNIPVLGNKESFDKVIKNEKIEEILIAIPSLNGTELGRVVDRLQGIENIKIKTVPGISEMIDNKPLSSQIRSVRIEDLLGRDEIVINDGSIRGLIENKVVFVTGGAGSIGSELARQIAKFSPQKLVTIDVNENDIYFLELELKRRYPSLDLTSEICNIREEEKLDFLFNKYRPNVVFHAAAHKHVPLMEHNPEEAIKNNIFGTKKVAECADRYRVERMVLISTDKAVSY